MHLLGHQPTASVSKDALRMLLCHRPNPRQGHEAFSHPKAPQQTATKTAATPKITDERAVQTPFQARQLRPPQRQRKTTTQQNENATPESATVASALRSLAASPLANRSTLVSRLLPGPRFLPSDPAMISMTVMTATAAMIHPLSPEDRKQISMPRLAQHHIVISAVRVGPRAMTT